MVRWPATQGRAAVHPTFDAHSAVPAPMVPAQVANFIRYWRDAEAVSPPEDTIGLHFLNHRTLLEQTLRPYVLSGRASGQSPADGGRLDESSPLVASTIDRLELTRAVLADHLNRQPAPRHARAGAHAGSEHAGDAGSGRRPAPPRPAAARARILRAPRAHGNAIRFSVRCLSGTCRIGTTVTAGRRTVARAGALTLRPGQRAHGDRQAHLSGTAGARAPRPVARHRHRDARRNGAPAREQVADVAQDAGADPTPEPNVGGGAPTVRSPCPGRTVGACENGSP